MQPVERRQRGRRASDPEAVRRGAIASIVMRSPVLFGLTLGLLIASVFLVLILSNQHGLHVQQGKLHDFESQSQTSRKAAAGAFCDAINNNARLLNRQVDYLAGIILTSVRESRPFEKVYRQFGLPPYKERLALAKKQADGLQQRKVPLLNCDRYVNQLERQVPG